DFHVTGVQTCALPILNASTQTKIAAPGKTLSHHALPMKDCASKSIRPHEGWGGCTPRPKNESAASDSIANASDKEVCTMIGPEMFGSTCLARTRTCPVPMVSDACTYGSVRTLRVLARAMRAKIGM